MNNILKAMEKIASKISLSFAFSQKNKEKREEPNNPINGQSVNIYVNNYGERKQPKVNKIYFISKLDNFYANEIVKEIIIKAELDDGSAAAFVPIEFGIEDVVGPTIKNTDKNGLVYIENIRIRNVGTYRIYAKDQNGTIINDEIKIKLNEVKIQFLTQPQDVSSKELLDEILVRITYLSGQKAANKQVRIEVNKKNVIFKGSSLKYTNEDGIVCFDDLAFTRTGGYKLKAVCDGKFVYSEPFHVFPPGVVIDFEKCESGSSEETEAFLTALLEKQSPGDIIKYNGEEY